MKIVAISGKAATGKSYICNTYFYKQYGFWSISLADSIKLKVIEDGMATFEEAFITKPKHIRKILQDAGTNPRNENENVWCDILLTQMKLMEYKYGINKFCCDDIRFKNEVKWIKNLGGFVFRIDAKTREAISGLSDEARNHISETDLDDVPFNEYFDGWIYNNIQEKDTLRWQIQNIMNHIVNKI